MSASLDSAIEAIEHAPDQPERYCEAFLSMFPVTGAAVSTIGDVLGSETLAASDAQSARIDELQFDLGEGPCWDAMRSARPVLAPVIRTAEAEKWPAFTHSVVQDGVTSLFAFPLAVGPVRFGAIDMYSSVPVKLTRSQTEQAGALAEIVSRHVLRRALAAIGEDPEVGVSAYSRRLIHQASGVVLAQIDVSADDARLVIQGQAFAAGTSMMAVAQDILDGRLRFTRDGSRIEVSE